jgi:hypothetical protein
MRSIALGISVVLLLSCTCFAVEIKNVKVSSNGSTITLTYDLFGKPGERKANVKIAVLLDGERYLPGVINIVGDYGSNTPVGLGKKISWDLLKDMPAGYKGSIKWELDAETEAGNDPFNMHGLTKKVKPPVVTEITVADPKSKLVWLRSPISGKQMHSAEEAASVIRKMNQTSYSGFSDWRLPKKEEFESLISMIELYGYKSGQSALPYLSKVGFKFGNESKLWAIDKSSAELSGKELYVSGSANYASSNATTRTSSSSNRYSQSSSTNSGGAGAFASNLSVKQRSADSGLHDLTLDTRNGYFYKYNGSDTANILAVRGDSSTEIYAVSVQEDVSITP